ncbi:MAG: matrixin family metalloprotease, partial [Candidatus Acidiferrales bacterium]
MTKKICSVVLAFLMLLYTANPAFAGGALETFDITAFAPSPIPGHILARVIPIKWDTRCFPVQYSMNTTLDPIPNPLGVPVMTLATAQAELQASLDQWNEIPTSFVDMHITGATGNLGLRGFDMVNELTFRTANNFNAIASSPSVTLIADSIFNDGDDIDGDGDSDVSSAISVCTDVDGDGDIEFPAGFYPAGTILDNDVQFNTKTSNGFRFTSGVGAIDTVTRSVDTQTVAVHEFGHSFGLSHSLDNQTSATDGDGATMFSFIDTGDPAAELGQRVINSDDIGWASFFYPEGTASSGPAGLQAGDVAFSSAFGLITGEVRHGNLGGEPVAGANVFAIDRKSDARIASGYSGTTNLSFNPVNGGLFFIPVANRDQALVNGNYVIPVPKGQYEVGVEPLDGQPAAAGNISFTGQIGAFYGQQNFNEEFYGNRLESDLERRPGRGKNVPVHNGRASDGIDITTNRTININQFGSRNFVGFVNVAAGSYYAVRVPASTIAATIAGLGGEDVLFQSIAYGNFVTDASVVPVFSEAMLTTGTHDPAT